jgi:hypothetical protein
MNPMRVVGWTVETVGLAAMGIGAGFGFAAWYNKTESDAFCNTRNQCKPEGLDLRNRSAHLGDVSTGMLIGGGLVALTGAILILVSPSKGNPYTTVGFGPSGMVVRGRF